MKKQTSTKASKSAGKKRGGKPATTIKAKAKKVATPPAEAANQTDVTVVEETKVTGVAQVEVGTEKAPAPKKHTKQALRDRISELKNDLATAQGSLEAAGTQMTDLASELAGVKQAAGDIDRALHLSTATARDLGLRVERLHARNKRQRATNDATE